MTLLGHQSYLDHGQRSMASCLKLLKNRTLPTTISAVANESNTIVIDYIVNCYTWLDSCTTALTRGYSARISLTRTRTDLPNPQPWVPMGKCTATWVFDASTRADLGMASEFQLTGAGDPWVDPCHALHNIHIARGRKSH